MIQESRISAQNRIATPETGVAQQETSVARLVSGIVDDAQELLKQQIALLKHEVRRDLKEARKISVSFGVCCVAGLLSVVLFSFMLVYLVNWLWPVVPLWVCFGIFGVVGGVVAISLFFVAKERLEEMTPLSQEALDATKENLQWTTKPR